MKNSIDVVPFGKYKGKDLAKLLSDSAYLRFLFEKSIIRQNCFRKIHNWYNVMKQKYEQNNKSILNDINKSSFSFNTTLKQIPKQSSSILSERNGTQLNSRHNFGESVIIPFGKYKGESLNNILLDREYCSYLLTCNWLKIKYNYIRNFIRDKYKRDGVFEGGLIARINTLDYFDIRFCQKLIHKTNFSKEKLYRGFSIPIEFQNYRLCYSTFLSYLFKKMYTIKLERQFQDFYAENFNMMPHCSLVNSRIIDCICKCYNVVKKKINKDWESILPEIYMTSLSYLIWQNKFNEAKLKIDLETLYVKKKDFIRIFREMENFIDKTYENFATTITENIILEADIISKNFIMKLCSSTFCQISFNQKLQLFAYGAILLKEKGRQRKLIKILNILSGCLHYCDISEWLKSPKSSYLIMFLTNKISIVKPHA